MTHYPLPELEIAFDDPTPTPLRVQEEGVVRWRDHQNNLVCLGKWLADGFVLDILAVGRFRWFTRSNEVRAVPYGAASRSKITDSFYRHIVPLWLVDRDIPVLHGSAVTTPRGVVAMCAPSRTGKSTLAYGLTRRGYPLWADDAVPIRFEPDGVWTLAVPHTLRLRRNAAAHYGAPKRSVPAADSWTRQRLPAPRPLAAILLLSRLDDHPDTPLVTIEQATAPEVLSVLPEHTHGFGFGTSELRKRVVSNCLKVAAKVPVYRVSYATRLDQLPQLLDALEAHLTEALPTPEPVLSGD